MTTVADTTATVSRPADRPRVHRPTGSLLVTGGALLAVGGQLHPRGSGGEVDAHLLSMFASPQWPVAHAFLLAGMSTTVAAFVVGWRSRAFGRRAQPWLPVIVAAWALGAAEVVPHLLAAGEAHALEHHQATPVLDLHLVLQVMAGPAVGLTGALVAVLVHLCARTRASLLLAGVAVVGGVLSAVAAPMLALTGDVAWTALFPLQAGLAVWLVGTGVRLLRRRVATP